MAILYIATCVLIFSLTLSPGLEDAMVYLYDLANVPVGLRTVLVDVILLIISCIFLAKKRTPVVKEILFTFLLWIPWLIYLGIRTDFTEIGLWKYGSYVLKVFVPCLVTAVIYKANSDMFRKYFMLTLLVVNLFLVIFFAIQGDTIGHSNLDRNIWLSRGLGINIIYLMLSYRDITNKLLAILIMPILLAIMIIIGARGPVLSVIMTSLLLAFVRYRKNPIMLNVLFMSGFILSLSVFYVDSLRASFESFVTHGHKMGMKMENAADSRLSVYKPTLEIFLEHPVAGVGLGKWWDHYRKKTMHPGSWFATKFKMEKKRDYTYPHNIILEILSELGLIGILLFILLFYPYRRLFEIKTGYSLLVILCFLYACTSSDITINSPLMIFNTLGILAFREASYKKVPGQKVSERYTI
jgi:O-antigen ligase